MLLPTSVGLVELSPGAAAVSVFRHHFLDTPTGVSEVHSPPVLTVGSTVTLASTVVNRAGPGRTRFRLQGSADLGSWQTLARFELDDFGYEQATFAGVKAPFLRVGVDNTTQLARDAPVLFSSALAFADRYTEPLNTTLAGRDGSLSLIELAGHPGGSAMPSMYPAARNQLIGTQTNQISTYYSPAYDAMGETVTVTGTVINVSASATVTFALEGSMNGRNWIQLATFAQSSFGYNSTTQTSLQYPFVRGTVTISGTTVEVLFDMSIAFGALFS